MTELKGVVEKAIRTLAIDLMFPDDCEVKFEEINLSKVLCSVAYKVQVKSGGRKISFFVKCLQCDKYNSFEPESRIFFRNELVFFGDFFGWFMEYDRCKKHPQVVYKGAPRCYKLDETTNLSFIIMEDVIAQGYRPLPKNKTLNLTQAFLVLEELGRLHGLSFVMKDQQPLWFANVVDGIEDTLFGEGMRPTFGRLFVRAMDDALELAKHSLPAGSLYVDKLASFTRNIYDKMSTLAHCLEDDDEPYKVVTHGDLRNNNILFRCDDIRDEAENPTSIRILDYQACRYASPVHDLAFFLLLSLDQKTREDYREVLIRRYHTTLCKTIYRLGSDPLQLFPYSALCTQIQRHTKFALGLALVGLPLYMDDGRRKCDEDDEEIGKEMNAEAVLYSAQEACDRKSMKCKNKMMEIIIDVVDQGYL